MLPSGDGRRDDADDASVSSRASGPSGGGEVRGGAGSGSAAAPGSRKRKAREEDGGGGSKGAAGESSGAAGGASYATAAADAAAADNTDACACMVCLDVMYRPARLSCGHWGCVLCLREVMVRGRAGSVPAKCPSCRAAIKEPRWPEDLQPDRVMGDMVMRLAGGRDKYERFEEPQLASDVTPDRLALYQAKAAVGDALGRTYLGACHYMGWGTVQVDKKAELLWRLAVKQGCASAKGWLGDLLADSGRHGEGVALLRQAAEAGHGFAANRLGEAHENGLYGLTVDKPEAARWWQKATGANRAMGINNFATAQLNAAEHGLAHHPGKAAELFELAAARGEPIAQNNLAVVLAYGLDGQAINSERAVKLLRAAVKAGYPTALLTYGRWCYAGVCGIQEDVAAAIGWWKKGDARGNDDCTVELAVAALKGCQGTGMTRLQAFSALEELAAAGNEFAQQRVDAMVEGLSEHPW